MAERRPLVLIAGIPQELPTADSIAAAQTVLYYVKADGTEIWLPSNAGEGSTVIPAASPSKAFFMAGW